MIKYKKGNLLDVTGEVIIHGCNSEGVMGSGVALAVKQKYPEAFEEYRKYCEAFSDQYLPGDTVSYLHEPTNTKILNAITQDSYGRSGVRYVSYDAVDSVFSEVSRLYERDTPINFPKIGAGLGGGEWSVISAIIKHHLKDFTNVTCWEL